MKRHILAQGSGRRRPLHTNKSTLQNVFCSVLCLVENTGIEPVTSCMPCKRSPS